MFRDNHNFLPLIFHYIQKIDLTFVVAPQSANIYVQLNTLGSLPFLDMAICQTIGTSLLSDKHAIWPGQGPMTDCYNCL